MPRVGPRSPGFTAEPRAATLTREVQALAAHLTQLPRKGADGALRLWRPQHPRRCLERPQAISCMAVTACNGVDESGVRLFK